jgi:hypothetical protein
MRRSGLASGAGIDGDDDRQGCFRGGEGMGRRAEDTRGDRGDRGYGKDVEKTSPGMAHAPAAQYRWGVSVRRVRKALGWV